MGMRQTGLTISYLSAFTVYVLASLVPFSAAAKTQVCSITINSNEEIEAFKKGLGTKDYEYTELTEISDSKRSWLDASCEKKINCDILLISGHFGGSFFGHKGLTLDLNELENISCNRECDGITRAPREVFLFGCNTLAGKGRDHRTPEEYRRVLIADNYSPEDAERIVAFRYSPIGDSFEDRMRRVFRFTPRIYGFNSVAPAGVNVEGYLKKYLKDIGPKYYREENLKKLSPEANKLLQTNLRETSFVQRPGMGDVEQSELPACYLANTTIPFHQKLNWIANRLNDPKHSLMSVTSIGTFLEKFRDHKWPDKEFEILERVTYNTSLRKDLENLTRVKDPAMFSVQLAIQDVMDFFGWISPLANAQALQKLLMSDREGGLSLADSDMICSVAKQRKHLRLDIKAEQISEAQWGSRYFLRALSCIAKFDEEIFHRMLSMGLNPNKSPKLEVDWAVLRNFDIPQWAADRIVTRFLSARGNALRVRIFEALNNHRAWWRPEVIPAEMMDRDGQEVLRKILIPTENTYLQLLQALDQTKLKSWEHGIDGTLLNLAIDSVAPQANTTAVAKEALRLYLNNPEARTSLLRLPQDRAKSDTEIQDALISGFIEKLGIKSEASKSIAFALSNVGSALPSVCERLVRAVVEKHGEVSELTAEAFRAWSRTCGSSPASKKLADNLFYRAARMDAGAEMVHHVAEAFYNNSLTFPAIKTLDDLWLANVIRSEEAKVVIEPEVLRTLRAHAEAELQSSNSRYWRKIIESSKVLNLPNHKKLNPAYISEYKRITATGRSGILSEAWARDLLDRIIATDREAAEKMVVEMSLKAELGPKAESYESPQYLIWYSVYALGDLKFEVKVLKSFLDSANPETAIMVLKSSFRGSSNPELKKMVLQFAQNKNLNLRLRDELLRAGGKP